MKLFYIIALVMVVLMVASPYQLLPDSMDGGKVVLRYEADGRPVFVESPIVTRGISPSAIKTIDSAVCGDSASGALLGQIYEGLLNYKYLEFDGPIPLLQPCLAEAMPTVSADRLTYTFKLKKGVKFHRNPCFGPLKTFDDIQMINASGEKVPMTVYKTREMTAEDFVLAFKRQADPYNNCILVWPFLVNRIVGLDAWRTKARAQFEAGDFRRYDLPIEGVKAVDRYTLQITLIKPFPQFIYLFAIPNLAPTPREAVDYWLAGLGGSPDRAIPVHDRKVEFKDAESSVGTGPYILKTFKRKDRWVIVRNPDYRFDPYPTKADSQFVKKGFLKDAGKAMPFIDKLVSVYTRQELPAWMLFLKGQRDAAGHYHGRRHDSRSPANLPVGLRRGKSSRRCRGHRR
jgi:oligopeptide transport system substrate-binding protein